MNWRELNKILPTLDEYEVFRLLEDERKGEQRVTVLIRLHQRYTMLRANRERKEMLRLMFQTNGLKWSVDAYQLYLDWTADLKGNRYQKMTEFIKATNALF